MNRLGEKTEYIEYNWTEIPEIWDRNEINRLKDNISKI